MLDLYCQLGKLIEFFFRFSVEGMQLVVRGELKFSLYDLTVIDQLVEKVVKPNVIWPPKYVRDDGVPFS